MKRYGNLYSKIYDIKNIQNAHLNARRGKSHYSEVQMVNANPEKYFIQIYNILKNKTFKNSEYTTYLKQDSRKERKIFKLPYFPDRIIHHCIVQILEDIWVKTLIADTYSSLKDRGIHKGVNRIKKALIDNKNTQYCLKMDVRKFYPSINHSILKTIIKQKIKDKNVIWLLDEIIDSTDGVPIGNYLSQFFGNLYLSNLDHCIKEKMKCKYYFRYCDDMVILHSDKKYLAEVRKQINIYLQNKLKLHLKSNWQVFPVDKCGIDFLGYKFYNSHTLLRKSISKKFKNNINKIIKSDTKHIEMVNSIMSYAGWMTYADCHNLSTAYINDDVVNISKKLCNDAGINNPLRGTCYG